MRFTRQTQRALIGYSLVAMMAVGCESTQKPTASDHQIPRYPQTRQTIVIDPAHPPQDGATLKSTYQDTSFGKTETRTDAYIRHADADSPTGWTPWHYRTYPHNWSDPLTYEETVSGSVTARVQSVDVANRRITLQGPSGLSETFLVGPQVQRLNEVSVGDNLSISYTATLFAELRPATAEEAANPIKYYSVINRASTDADPVGAQGTAVRVVTTVDAVNLAAMTVTLKGPLGNRVAIRARSQENIRKLHVGDTVLVKYSQGVALALDKTP